MRTHCKNNAIHNNINSICIARVLIHRKNNAVHCKINDMRVAWMLVHCKNNTIHCKINGTCNAWMLTPCRNKAIPYQINGIHIYIYIYMSCLDANPLYKTTLFIMKQMIYVVPECANSL